MKDPQKLRDEGEPSYKIRAAWNVFSNYYDHWHASYVNWSVYFGGEEAKAGLDVGLRLPQTEARASSFGR